MVSVRGGHHLAQLRFAQEDNHKWTGNDMLAGAVNRGDVPAS
jgi:hypothetical protein